MCYTQHSFLLNTCYHNITTELTKTSSLIEICDTLSGSRDACNLFKYNADMGSGCGSIGRAVTSDIRARGTPFKLANFINCQLHGKY